MNEGFELTERPQESGIIVVNTCGFIDPAKEESIEAILEAALYKKSGKLEALVVAGCMVERFREDLERLIPEVDLFLGLDEEGGIGKALKEKLGLAPEIKIPAAGRGHGRVFLTPPHLSFLKIAEGCSRRCSFCTIPSIRGQFRSKSIDELVKEAQHLESLGVRELNVISQDTVSYRDRSGRGLVELLRQILSNTGIPWIRLLYLNPAGFGDDLMDLLGLEERLLAYVDIPIQHISNTLLKRMGRGVSREDIEALIWALRQRVPGVTLRTTVLVGFPGEEDDHFRELLDFLEEVQFERLGVFPFSCEEGTPASRLPGQVAEEVKQERCFQVMELQRAISWKKCRARRGTRTEVIVDTAIDKADPDDEVIRLLARRPDISFIGRSRCEAYEVDGVIYLAGEYEVGEFADVRIVDSMEYDLVGERN